MLLVQELTRPVGGVVRPVCRNCGRSMHVTRIGAAPGGLPELRTYSCGECGIGVTEAVGRHRDD